MATTLTLTLSQDMQTWLSHGGSGNGVHAFAVLYGSGTAGGAATLLDSAPLVENGQVRNGGTVTLDLTTATQDKLYGGKAYIILQSIDPADAPIDRTTLAQDDINWINAAALDYRYDSIEVSLTGESGDAANLTEIEGFGIAMTLSATTGTRGYAVPADTLFTSLGAAATQIVPGQTPIATFTAGGLAGSTRQVVSPTVAVVADNNVPFYASDDWSAYIEALKTPATPIVVNGFFNGAPDQIPGGGTIWRNAGFFSYELTWHQVPGVFWLTPTLGSEIRGAIRLTPDQLAQSIYSSLGTVELHDAFGDTPAFDIYPGVTAMNVGANNAWGQVLQQLTLGLTAGYLESTGTPVNAAVGGTVDLNRNYNWDPSYAFGTDTTTALPHGVQRFDPYAHAFFPVSNAYATQYGDALTNGFAQGSPLLPTYANGGNVTALTATLYADGEVPSFPLNATPPVTTGFVAPVIHNYVAGTGQDGQYAPALWQPSNPSNITLNFNPGDSQAQSLVLRDDVQISIRILIGYEGTEPQWQTIKIGDKKDTPWQTWTFGHTGDAFTISGNGGVGQASQSLVLTGLPMPDSGTGWYQIVVEGGDFEKTYNLYTTTYIPTGESIPVFADFTSDPALFGVDGLATLTPGQANSAGGLLTFAVNVTGVTPTLDLSLMEANTTAAYLSNQVTRTAPVAGTLQGGAFVALPGQAADPQSGGAGIPLAVTSQSGLLAFGWTGLNDVSDTATWIESFTNLVPGLAVAQVSISGGGGGLGPLLAKADITGAWQTGTAQQFGNGTYQVSMAAFGPKGANPDQPAPHVPLTKPSAVLTVTVALSDLDLHVAPDGQALALAGDGGGTQGNWIHLAAQAAALPDGVAAALYATDAAGRPVGADGLPVADITEAILGWVGSVGGDGGASLLRGRQSVYLPLGQELHVALLEDGATAPRPVATTLRDNGDGSFTIEAGGIALVAQVENTLSAEAAMAAPQRMFGLPLLWLEHGQSLAVDIVGSAYNRNTLGFVRLDLDQATGQLSLDGVAADDAGFRDAVRAALDGGYRATAGGADFAETTTWSVAGEDGYYAPVLITESGDIFVPGASGPSYLRIFGENSFGFEDLIGAQGSDYDFNDMVMRLAPLL